MDELVQVYQSNHPQTKIEVDYKTEADCLRDALNDSIRLLFVTRRLSLEEKGLLADSLRLTARRFTTEDLNQFDKIYALAGVWEL